MNFRPRLYDASIRRHLALNLMLVWGLAFASLPRTAIAACSKISGSGANCNGSNNLEGCRIPVSTVCKVDTADVVGGPWTPSCRQVTCNGSCAGDLFVPIKSSAEWSSFLAAVGTVTGLSVASCDCPAGYGGASCTICSAGTYDSVVGGTEACVPCPAGTYQGSNGQSSCASASAGYFAAGTGNISQTACGTGTFQNLTGQSSCSSCTGPVGSHTTTFAASSALTTNSCPVSSVTCQAGYYRSGVTQCIQCNTGTYQTTNGFTGGSCTSCGSAGFVTVWKSNAPRTSSGNCFQMCSWNTSEEIFGGSPNCEKNNMDSVLVYDPGAIACGPGTASFALVTCSVGSDQWNWSGHQCQNSDIGARGSCF